MLNLREIEELLKDMKKLRDKLNNLQGEYTLSEEEIAVLDKVRVEAIYLSDMAEATISELAEEDTTSN